MICPRLTTSVSGGLDVWQHHRQRWILPWLYIPPSVSRLGPLMIGACVVSKHSPCPERSSLYPNTHTHTHHSDVTPFQQLSARSHEVGQCFFSSSFAFSAFVHICVKKKAFIFLCLTFLCFNVL